MASRGRVASPAFGTSGTREAKPSSVISARFFVIRVGPWRSAAFLEHFLIFLGFQTSTERTGETAPTERSIGLVNNRLYFLCASKQQQPRLLKELVAAAVSNHPGSPEALRQILRVRCDHEISSVIVQTYLLGTG
jgi:hypothetical protein